MARPGAVISSTKALLVSIQALLPESGEVGLGPSAAAAKLPVASTMPAAPPNVSAQPNTPAFLCRFIVDHSRAMRRVTRPERADVATLATAPGPSSACPTQRVGSVLPLQAF